jgi:hypothetical protein
LNAELVASLQQQLSERDAEVAALVREKNEVLEKAQVLSPPPRRALYYS